MSRFGLDNFEKMKSFIIEILKKKSISPTLTFAEHFNKTKHMLIIDALCINTRRNTYFNYKSHPDMPILIAIQASMSIPMLFTCVQYEGFTYVDGGSTGDLISDQYLDIYPVDDRKPESIICINLFQESRVSCSSINTLGEYLVQLTNCISEKIGRSAVPNIKGVHYFSLFDDVVETIGLLAISKEMKTFLIDLGYKKIVFE